MNINVCRIHKRYAGILDNVNIVSRKKCPYCLAAQSMPSADDVAKAMIKQKEIKKEKIAQKERKKYKEYLNKNNLKLVSNPKRKPEWLIKFILILAILFLVSPLLVFCYWILINFWSVQFEYYECLYSFLFFLPGIFFIIMYYKFNDVPYFIEVKK